MQSKKPPLTRTLPTLRFWEQVARMSWAKCWLRTPALQWSRASGVWAALTSTHGLRDTAMRRAARLETMLRERWGGGRASTTLHEHLPLHETCE